MQFDDKTTRRLVAYGVMTPCLLMLMFILLSTLSSSITSTPSSSNIIHGN